MDNACSEKVAFLKNEFDDFRRLFTRYLELVPKRKNIRGMRPLKKADLEELQSIDFLNFGCWNDAFAFIEPLDDREISILIYEVTKLKAGYAYRTMREYVIEGQYVVSNARRAKSKYAIDPDVGIHCVVHKTSAKHSE